MTWTNGVPNVFPAKLDDILVKETADKPMALKGPLCLSIQNLTSKMNIDEFLEFFFAESDNLPLDDQHHRKLFALHLHMHMKADFKEIFEITQPTSFCKAFISFVKCTCLKMLWSTGILFGQVLKETKNLTRRL
jgi:hypothetical protein